MLGKTKNFLFNLYKKKTILFVFFFSFFGLIFAKSASSAGWVTELAINVATWPLFQIAYISIDLAIFLAGWAGSLLNWVLSPNFISYSYTNPGGPNANPIIEAGLGVTQGFVNMLLVLILVYIAIATILRLAGYETKKLLITFIIVALLVNFAPVITGVIVDASNIIMNFFVQDLEGDAFGNAMGRKVGDIMSGYNAQSDYTTARPYVIQIIVLIPFLLGLTFILLLFTAIFMFRYIMIWLLVILSPLAFACYILPNTRKYFDKWWEQFINWSFIGVTCGFFLYLGLLLVTKIQAGDAVGVPAIAGQQAPFNAILPFFVSLAFLGIGLVFGLQTSAIGASTVISLTKRAQRWTGRRGKWIAKESAKKIGSGIRPVVERPARKAAAVSARFLGRIGNWGIPGMRRIKPLAFAKWATPKKFRDFGNLRPTIEKAAKEAESESGLETADKILTQKMKGAEGTGLLYKLLKTNDAQDLFKRAKSFKRWKNFSDEKLLKDQGFIDIIAPLLKNAADSGMTGTMLRRDPRLAKIAAVSGIRGYKGLSPQEAVTKAVGEAREHIKDWEPESLKDPEVLMACLAQFDRDRWLQINRQVKEGQNTAQESMDKIFAKFKRDKKLTHKSDTNVWNGKFREFIKTNYGGDKYFIAVPEKRMQSTGWREAQTPTAGSAAMGSQSPKEKTKPLKPDKKASSIPTTGIQGKKASNIPTTGKEVKKETKPKKEAQIPTMITREMRSELKKAGYINEDIKKMTPKEAWEKLGRTF